VTRVCYAENPASHRLGHSGTSSGIWVCDGPKCNLFDILGFTTLICPFIVASDGNMCRLVRTAQVRVLPTHQAVGGERDRAAEREAFGRR